MPPSEGSRKAAPAQIAIAADWQETVIRVYGPTWRRRPPPARRYGTADSRHRWVSPAGQIPLTCNEIAALFITLIINR